MSFVVNLNLRDPPLIIGFAISNLSNDKMCHNEACYIRKVVSQSMYV